MNMAFYTTDDSGYREFQYIDEALSYADDCIEVARGCCDPEWPLWGEDVAIYEASSGCEYPDEDGKVVYHAVECDIRFADEDSDVDYFCDYMMRQVKEDTDK